MPVKLTLRGGSPGDLQGEGDVQLLRQPGGFKRILQIATVLVPNDFAVPECPDVSLVFLSVRARPAPAADAVAWKLTAATTVSPPSNSF